MKYEQENKVYFERIGIKKPIHQRILIDNLPCGIESVEEVMNDKTSCEINAPRALLICHWLGMLRALKLLEVSREKQGRKSKT